MSWVKRLKWRDYIEALEKSYPENPLAICVAKEVYSMFNPAPAALEMCACGHEREAHFEFGCGCETERDVTCECKEFRRL